MRFILSALIHPVHPLVIPYIPQCPNRVYDCKPLMSAANRTELGRNYTIRYLIGYRRQNLGDCHLCEMWMPSHVVLVFIWRRTPLGTWPDSGRQKVLYSPGVVSMRTGKHDTPSYNSDLRGSETVKFCVKSNSVYMGGGTALLGGILLLITRES